MFISKQQRFASIFLGLFIISTMLVYFTTSLAECAPTNNSNGNTKNTNGNNGNTRNGGIFSSLFRRQTGSSSNSESNTDSSNNESTSTTEADLEDPQTQTELEAEKFVDSLPIPKANTSSGPTTFRERVSDTFGLLRDGVSNHFRSVRENFSDTVEDLRDTWSSNNQE